jgi:hypothetical protein
MTDPHKYTQLMLWFILLWLLFLGMLVSYNIKQHRPIAKTQMLDVCLDAASTAYLDQKQAEDLRDYCIRVYDWRFTE